VSREALVGAQGTARTERSNWVCTMARRTTC